MILIFILFEYTYYDFMKKYFSSNYIIVLIFELFQRFKDFNICGQYYKLLI